ncbi:MAG: universal stress protein [Gammaproteobacteria bacterium]|jgi:nucleotide-binding universal stress UspA family protein
MYQRILVAIDGSQTSNQALQEAITLGKALHSKLRLIHVVDIIGASWYSGEFTDLQPTWDFLIKSGRELLEQASQTVTDAGVTVDSHLEEINGIGRHIAEVIIEQAGDWHADLIVLGTHGRRGLNRVLLGSVAEGVMRLAETPVLLIRSNSTTK